MKDNGVLLFKTLLLSTSPVNILRHSKDKKKRRRIIGGAIGVAFLYILLMGFGALMCIGYGTFGMIESAPVMCALTISGIALVFTFFKTNGYLFNFKEYDMLMSLPFKAGTIAGCKFLYMYVKSLPWYVSLSASMMIGYGYYARPAFFVYPLWLVLSVFLPVIPMLAASFFGFLIARVSAGFKKRNVIQTVLTFVLILFGFSLRFIIQALFKNNQMEMTLAKTAEVTGNAGRIYMPAGWFSNAVTKLNIADALLLIGISVLLFTVVFLIVGRSYRNINSALKSHAAAKSYKMSAQKQRSALQAIAFKEFRRMTGSTLYMTQAGTGAVIATILGILTLIIGFDKIIDVVTQGAPIQSYMLQPAIPFIVYFFTGMLATTAVSPSLEGKNYWIIQSLPLENRTICQGKMLFNMYLSVPFTVFSILCLCISSRTPVPDMLLYLLLGIVLCAFSTAWGCVCGIKHRRLDWENEVEVVKQGAAVTIYLLPNLIAVIGLTVLVVFLGTRMDHKLVTLIMTAAAAVLAVLCYRVVLNLSKRM